MLARFGSPGKADSIHYHCYRWIAEEAQSEVDRVWTAGVEDYLTYVKGLCSEYSDVLEGEGKADPTPPAPPAFQLPASSTPNLSFGGAALAAPGAFAFGTPAAAAPGPQADDDEAEPEEEPTEVAMGGDDVEVLLKQRVSMLSMTPEKKWKSMGQGTVTLRRPASSAARPFVAFTTDTGRVLLTAPLLKGLKPSFNPNKPANLIMMLANSVGTKEPQSAMYIIKCLDGDAAKELRTAVNEHA